MASQDKNDQEATGTNIMAGDTAEMHEDRVTCPGSSSPTTTFVKQIEEYKAELEDNYKTFEEDMQDMHRQSDLEKMDWTDLERRYRETLEPVISTEEELFTEFLQRFSQFQLWIKISRDREAERAFKRLRTRMAFVQNSEASLAAKEDHYSKVVNAFQSAMALLANV